MNLEYFAFSGIILMILIFATLAILSVVFWIWTIIDCARRNFKGDTEKIVWILILIFLGILGSIIYYFAIVYQKRRK